MLSAGAVAFSCLLVYVEGYATVRDDRIFASSRTQQNKTSTTSDRDGDMTVSLGVQADGSISDVKGNVDGVHELEEEGSDTEVDQSLMETQDAGGRTPRTKEFTLDPGKTGGFSHVAGNIGLSQGFQTGISVEPIDRQSGHFKIDWSKKGFHYKVGRVLLDHLVFRKSLPEQLWGGAVPPRHCAMDLCLIDTVDPRVAANSAIHQFGREANRAFGYKYAIIAVNGKMASTMVNDQHIWIGPAADPNPNDLEATTKKDWDGIFEAIKAAREPVTFTVRKLEDFTKDCMKKLETQQIASDVIKVMKSGQKSTALLEVSNELEGIVP